MAESMSDAAEMAVGADFIVPSLVELETTARRDPDEAPTTPELLDFGTEFFYDHWTQAGRRGRGKGSYFRASSLGSCPRSQFLQRAGVPKSRVLDTKTKRKFQWGDDIEWYAGRRLQMLGLLLAQGTEVDDDELHLSGTFDLLWGGYVQPVEEAEAAKLWDRMHMSWASLVSSYSLPAGTPFEEHMLAVWDATKTRLPRPEWIEFLTALREKLCETHGQRFPVTLDEVKSQHSYAMQRRLKEGAAEHHMLQLAAYKLLAERHPEALPEGVEGIERYRNLLIGKDAVGYLYFPLTSQYTDQAMDHLDTLNHWWDKEVFPPCTCEAGTWQVEYCSYGQGTKTDPCCTGFEDQFEEAKNDG